MKTYTINDLYASAWQSAIENIKAFVKDADYRLCEQLADDLELKFDVNGEIIK